MVEKIEHKIAKDSDTESELVDDDEALSLCTEASPSWTQSTRRRPFPG